MPLSRAARRADSIKVARSHLEPLVVLVEPRLPADSFCPGHRPAHEARWPDVGNTLMSTPISARITSALRWPTPGMLSRRSRRPSKGAIAVSIRTERAAMSASRSSTCESMRSSKKAWRY